MSRELENIPTWQPVVALRLVGRDGHWLMHCRPQGKAHAGLWEFPGGKVENGETPRLAMVREAQEELGIALATEDLKPSGFAEGNGIVLFLYTATRWAGSLEAREGGKLAWFDPAAVSSLEMPELDHALVAQLRRRQD